MPSAPIVITKCAGLRIVRDDLIPGGTKARALPVLMQGDAREFVYASPVYGAAQLALAVCARHLGKRATIFCAQRKTRHERTKEAARAGATIIEVPMGFMTVVTKRARDYCADTGASLLPFGLDHPDFIAALAEVARTITPVPEEVWSIASSGVLARALQLAWPTARHNAIRTGAEPNAGMATLYVAPERFEQDAKRPPPFPSNSNYDAKAWQFVSRYASPGALFWNVSR